MIKRRKPIKRHKPLRAQKAILRSLSPLQRSAKGKLRAQQRLAYKLAYCKDHGEKENDLWKAPCQSCGRIIPLTRADFSHKVPAGRGGDVGGQVQASNGIFSCRPCHDFVEGDATARQELIASTASTESGGIVAWTPTTYRRLHLFIAKHHGS